jgi:pimeloyl-ACP methyl ester carboxylesterase
MVNGPFDLALLHGGGQGSWVWEATLAALQSQADGAFDKILALDVPGCGTKRGRVTDHLDPRDVARELVDELERADMQRIVLVGHSLAGNVLPAIAALRADLFRRLVYVSCSIPLQGQTLVQMMGKGLHGSKENEVGWPVDPSTTPRRDRYEIMYCGDMTENQRAAFLDNHTGNEWPRRFFTATDFSFTNLDAVPATYVVCLKDRALPVAWQETFAERLHAQRLIRIDAGHQVMITRPHALAEVLRQEARTDTPGKS